MKIKIRNFFSAKNETFFDYFIDDCVALRHSVFKDLPKSRIQHCERSELRLHIEWTKVH